MAAALEAHNEFIDRYNAIHPREGVFRLRRLSDDARISFEKDGNIVSGLVWAMCQMDMGNTKVAEDLLSGFVVSIPLEPGNYVSDLLYLNYARLLGHTGRLQNAVKILDRLLPVLHEEEPLTLNWVMGVYAEAGELEKAYKVFELYAKLHPDTWFRLVNPSLIYYSLSKEDQDSFEHSLHTYARCLGFQDLNLENFEQFVDKMADSQTHPSVKPGLWDGEYERITRIEQACRALLEADEAWEAAVMPEVLRRQQDPDDEVISFDDVVKSLGLENIV